ncbi:MAG: putative metal-dependent rane protease [Bacteroidota bacterium]|jgi:membrane protease YdiL (CAAX protease family)|nr:putative metal-dependent rane protease [Bacteroidota bacterium]
MEHTGQERHSWIKLSALLIFMLAYGMLNVIGSDSDINLNFDDENMMIFLKIAQAVSVIIIFILPAVLIAVFWTQPKFHYLGLTTKPAVATLFIAGIGILFAMPVINWLAEMNQHMELPSVFAGMEEWMRNSEDKATQLTEGFTRGTSISTLILNLFVIAFMAALSEEIFFRGIFQKVAIECFKNKHAGVWFGAIVFSAFHMQFFGFVPRMLMGAYLGYLFLWSGSLWPGIVAHFINNGAAVLMVWLSNRGVISVNADKIGIEQSELIYVAISGAAVIASLVLVHRIESKRSRATLAQSAPLS